MTSTPDEIERLVQLALNAEREQRRKERRERLRTAAAWLTPLVTMAGVVVTVIVSRT